MARKISKQSWSVAVVVVGALATIATSPVQSEGVQAESEFSLGQRGVMHVDVTFDELAMDHVRTFPTVSQLVVDVRPEFDGDLRVITDDEAFPPQSSGTFVFGLDACPDEGSCTLGLTVEERSGRLTSVVVAAAANTSGDSSFFFAQNREYPADASVTIERSE